MSFLGHFQVLVFLYALLLFSAESRKTQLFDTESSTNGAEHENYGDKVDARDIPLLYLETKVKCVCFPVGSPQRQEALKNLLEEINHRKQIDQNIIEILRLSLKQTDVLDLLTSTRTTGQPVVDDWDCYKTLVKSFKNQCGAKMEYDMKYAGALANICNMGVDVKQSVAAIEEACAH
ncbi:PREDICTED: vacuolar-processing enzyme delta-isozyme-like [Brassica oleracea var. oleracea]|uniref:vacuolar-processing enzyme delta-isozyme-like n=1 Tax=Brassica oleracea var. oleracea TaxID=109376 RepID=UPI0006A756B8|nr:PREDICTED: vacuolar-processing enzyme delta-isozyme-like [Brassica oleracea var. oleracea]